jgi:hypothetical protein
MSKEKSFQQTDGAEFSKNNFKNMINFKIQNAQQFSMQ